jgi:hypothetical protein
MRRELQGSGSYVIFTRTKSMRVSQGGGSLSVFLHTITFVFSRICAPCLQGRQAPPSAAARAHAPYSLHIRPHGLHQRAIANAAAGVANPARVSYSENGIARLGDTNARGVSNANARGVCDPYPARVRVGNCARVADANPRPPADGVTCAQGGPGGCAGGNSAG